MKFIQVIPHYEKKKWIVKVEGNKNGIPEIGPHIGDVENCKHSLFTWILLILETKDQLSSIVWELEEGIRIS